MCNIQKIYWRLQEELYSQQHGIVNIYIKTVYALCILGTLTVVVKLKHLTVGGDERDRTADPLLARQVLSQLSYTPMSVKCL